MPNLARLKARGCYGTTESVEGFFVGSTWPSLYTSSNPARHGFHYQYQVFPGDYALKEMGSGRLAQGTSFWEEMSVAEKRICILDVPLSQPCQSINGIQLVEWGSHDAIGGFAAVPPEFGSRILEDFGMHPVGAHCDAPRTNVDDIAAFRQQLRAGVETRTQMTLALLQQERWHFVMQVFSETHCAGHQCWHLHDASHPAFDLLRTDAVGDVVHDVYKAVDEAVGRILDASVDSTVIVFSSHGMSYWYGADFLLKDILVRLGVATGWNKTFAARGKEISGRAISALWMQLPERARQALKAWLRPEPGVTPQRGPKPGLPVDPSNSLCFPVRNGMAHSGIRLNLIGRERNGLLSRGDEEEAFIRELTTDLLDIVDERTRQPLVSRVLRTKEVCQGPLMEGLPDLLVEWSSVTPTGSAPVADGVGSEVAVSSPKIGRLTGRNDFGRTGEHRRYGMLIGAGKHVIPGDLNRTVSVLDLAPTFCRLVDVDMKDAEGTAIPEIVGKEPGSA